jgi:glutamate-1-semialdehyde 2,1-aminomutase
MRRIAPAGTVYQAGTLSGNPLAMRAGIATLTELLSDPRVFAQLSATSAMLADAMRAAGQAAGVPVQAAHAGGMWGFFFAASPVSSYEDARTADTGLYARFFHAALERGVYLAPSQFEAAFVSTAHAPAIAATSVAALTEAVAIAATTAPSASG